MFHINVKVTLSEGLTTLLTRAHMHNTMVYQFMKLTILTHIDLTFIFRTLSKRLCQYPVYCAAILTEKFSLNYIAVVSIYTVLRDISIGFFSSLGNFVLGRLLFGLLILSIWNQHWAILLCTLCKCMWPGNETTCTH